MLAVLVLSALAAPAASGTTGADGAGTAAGVASVDRPAGAASSIESGAIEIDHVVEQRPEAGVVRVRTTYDLPQTVALFNVTTENERITVTGTTGFERDGGRLEWTEFADTRSPSVTWEFDTNETSEVFGDYNTVGTGEWALFDIETPDYDYRYVYGAPEVRSRVSLSSGTTGYTVGDLVYLGEYETRTVERGDQRYTVLVPASVSSPPNESAVADTFVFARDQLAVGAANGHVVSVVGTEPLRGGGVQYAVPNADGRTTAMWVHEDESARGTAYYSEYIHTRQGFYTTDRMNWVIEGQDEYYNALLELYRGDATYEQFHADVADEEHASAVLAPPERTAYKREADYDKGGRVLAALDAEIRRTTDRNRSLEDVWRRMNAHEGELNYAEFTDIVATVAGQSFDDWLDRYLTTTAAPTVPDNRTLYAPVDAGVDSDGDGITTQGELANGTNPFASAEQVDSANDTSTADAVVVLSTFGGIGVGSLGLMIVLLARGLDRFVDWVPAILSQRSLVRLALLVVGSVAVLFGYFWQFS